MIISTKINIIESILNYTKSLFSKKEVIEEKPKEGASGFRGFTGIYGPAYSNMPGYSKYNEKKIYKASYDAMSLTRIKIRKMFEFEAAHHLPAHPGACHNLHGHSYKLAISIVSAFHINSETGMVMDFSDLKNIVNDKIISKLDHKNLNEVFDFYPTAEQMTYWIWDQLKDDLNLYEIELWETSGSNAILTRK